MAIKTNLTHYIKPNTEIWGVLGKGSLLLYIY